MHLWFEVSFDASINPQSIVDRYSVLAEVELAKPVYKKVRIDGDTDPIKIGKLKSEIVNLDNVKINDPNNKKIDKSLL